MPLPYVKRGIVELRETTIIIQEFNSSLKPEQWSQEALGSWELPEERASPRVWREKSFEGVFSEPCDRDAPRTASSRKGEGPFLEETHLQ